MKCSAARPALVYFAAVVFVFFPRMFSAIAKWMSTILPHMMWP